MTTPNEWLLASKRFQNRAYDVVTIKLDGLSGATESTLYLMSNDAPDDIPIRLGLTMHAQVLSVEGITTLIQPDQFNTVRGRRTIECLDEVAREDFDFPVSTVTSGGSFWERFDVGFREDWFGMDVEVISMFDTPEFDSLDKGKVMFSGFLEDINFLNNRRVHLRVKDKFTFDERRRQAPSAISTSNTLQDDLTTGSTHITVGVGSEFTDPSDWDSQDYVAPSISLATESTQEKIIYTAVNVTAGGTDYLLVGANRARETEDLTLAAWEKTDLSVLGETDGPFGNTNGHRFFGDGTGSPSLVHEGDGSCAGFDIDGSLWLRQDPTDAAATVQLIFRNAAGTESASTVIGLTNAWLRYDAAVAFSGAAGASPTLEVKPVGSGSFAFQVSQPMIDPGTLTRRPYVSRTIAGGRPAATAGRGAFGTVVTTHDALKEIVETVEYRRQSDETEGLHPVLPIMRDLINRNLTLSSIVDQDTFVAEYNFSVGNLFRRTIDSAEEIGGLISDLRRDSMSDIWVSQEGLVRVRQSFRPTGPGETAATIKSGIDIVQNMPEVMSNRDQRITSVVVGYNFQPSSGSEATADDLDQYDNIEVRANFTASGLNQRAFKGKTVLSQWIYREAEALALAGRLLDRYKLGARKVNLVVSFQRYDDLQIGEYINIQHSRLRTRSGTEAVQGQNRYQVTGFTYPGDGEDIRLQTLEGVFGRFGFIAPNFDLESGSPTPFPDYNDASEAELAYAFIVGPSLTFDDGTGPYLII